MQLTLEQHTLNEGSSPPLYPGRKLGALEQTLLFTLLRDDPQCPSRVLLEKAAKQSRPIAVSIRHLNRWRAVWQRPRRQGRPRRASSPGPVVPEVAVVKVTPHVLCVGVHLLAHWLDQQGAFGPIVALLKQAIEAHKHAQPEDDFALLQHHERTLERRFQALFFAPLFGIERLSEFDTREHPLETLLGRGYQSSTLHQFLGQLERVDAAEALLPALLPRQPTQIAYVDGHMIAYWSRVPMHKGKITMLGRIMAGSQAVITHHDTGQAVFVAYYPPDIHLSQVISDYCHTVAAATGSTVFVIDRAVNAVALARAFDEQGLGLLCMLDDNEHQGLESFEATHVDTLADGTRVYSGPWKVAREDDPRRFVVVEPTEGKPLVYWGTPQVETVLEATAWPRVYRARTEIQENSFKRMIDHGALNTNYGRKKIVGPDRHQQRARAKLEAALEAAQKRVDTKAEALQAKQDQVAESAAKGHGKRLEQRRRARAVLDKELQKAAHKRDQLAEQEGALGPTGQRADRDVRKQMIMTVRTLLLENALMAFMAVLSKHVHTTVSLACLLRLLFARSGGRIETDSHVLYWVNTAGVSVPYRRLLIEITQGLCAMGLQDQGKPIRVCLKDMPP